MNVYEVRDVSDDEMYFTLGVFPSLEAFTNLLPDFRGDPVSERAEERETIAVFSRMVGDWDDGGVEVFRIEREEAYDEDLDEYYWKEVVEV